MASKEEKSEDFINDDIVKETDELIEKQKTRIKKIMGGRKLVVGDKRARPTHFPYPRMLSCLKYDIKVPLGPFFWNYKFSIVLFYFLD